MRQQFNFGGASRELITRTARALLFESKAAEVKTRNLTFIRAPIYQLQEISRTMNLFAIARTGAKFLPILIFLSVFLVNYVSAQKRFTRQQFSRLGLLERAAFFEETILQTAQAEGVDPNLLWTIAYNETRFRPWLTSPKNARGLMQFIPSTAARFDLSDPYEPTQAIAAAARYVKYLRGFSAAGLIRFWRLTTLAKALLQLSWAGEPFKPGAKRLTPPGEGASAAFRLTARQSAMSDVD